MSKIFSTFLRHFIQKRFLNTISTSTLPLASVFTIEFLKNSCGFALENPSAGRKFQIDEKNIQECEAVIGFLKSHEFENPQIAKLVSGQPAILRFSVSTNLKPKFEFLQEIGLVGPLLRKLILSKPRTLCSSLDSRLKPSFFFLKEMLESDEEATAAICRSPWLLTCDKRTMKSNIDFLASEGVPSRYIAKLVVMYPKTMTRKVDTIIRAVKMIKELGIQPKAGAFVEAIRVRVQTTDSTWMKKINILKSLGWSENAIFTTFKRYPLILTCSEEKMRVVTDFCVNTARLDPGALITYPCFFKYSVDKRLQPRYKVFEVLKGKNLLKNIKIAGVFKLGERKFVENYVVKHLDEIPNLMDIYRGNVAAETKSVL